MVTGFPYTAASSPAYLANHHSRQEDLSRMSLIDCDKYPKHLLQYVVLHPDVSAADCGPEVRCCRLLGVVEGCDFPPPSVIDDYPTTAGD